MTAYSSNQYAAHTPAGAHGQGQITNHHHSVVSVPASLAAGDQCNMGFLPPGAVVLGVVLKAAGQLDSGAAPALTLNVGLAGLPQLFLAGTVLVGRAVGVSADSAITASGRLYKNSSAARQPITVTVQAAAATPVAGTLELELSYFIEDAVGSPA